MAEQTNRRAFAKYLVAGIATVATSRVAWAIESGKVHRNLSGFVTRDWKPYFSNLRNNVILVDTQSRSLHFWSEDGSDYRLYPTSVPISPELTRLGRTKVIKKVKDPSWRPTPAMLERNPDWPPFMPPGPDNPMGTHALYLSWQYYRIHGTHDTRKIGRRSSNGCIGLYNEHISELFDLAEVGTQVLLI
ncbi:MAG: L,D-transpeptidase [Rhodobacteraceae bacterium]|nr:L,D-transpeptidase [Paracoccaceae bacterium]MCY4196051.1 L,D-transpeptidase [Paracoccaceae bacterium]MCY4328423.1 L,D-transpeptidase [Paracoccaceae bacterium]